MPLVQLRELSVAFGDLPILDSVNLVIERGERWALLGRNGAGKSTLLGVLEGRVEADGGDVVRERGTRIAMLPQHIERDTPGTITDVVTAATDALPHVVQAVISRTGLDPDARFAQCSAGLQRRALLACTLAHEPDVLLLDEPTNHLDLEAIAWLEQFLLRERLTLLFVTHDRAFLRRIATGILHLDRGHLTRYPADYDAYRVMLKHAAKVEAQTQALFDKRHAQEEAWIRQGVRERRKRNQGRVQRLLAMRDQRRARRQAAGSASIQAQGATPSGRLVAEVKALTHRWHTDSAVPAADAPEPLIRDFDFTLLRGDRVGLLGPNGVGKTTLLRLLLGELEPESGTVRIGTGVRVGYFDQRHDALGLDATAMDNVSDGTTKLQIGGKERHVISYLEDFLFTPAQAKSPVRLFSGGERNRLVLARLFSKPTNVLVLDEPTNDLDVETIEVLERVLESYEGTVLLVSHDREFLEQSVDSLLVFEGEGKIRHVIGGPSALERLRKEAARAAAPTPTKEAKRQVRDAAKGDGATPRLSKEERKELRLLPKRIEELETRREELHAKMADPAFFKQAGEAIAAAQQALAELESEIAAAYARWEVLEA